MIIVYKDNIPVACYDGISPYDALRSYADEICNRPHTAADINVIGVGVVECKCKKCRARTFTEDL